MIRAINDVVIIERDGYNGMIIAPKEKMCHGTVISVGPGAWSASVWDIDPITRSVKEKWRPTSLKPGQRVCFSLDKGEEHVIEGKNVVVMRESHIAGVLDENNGYEDIVNEISRNLARKSEEVVLSTNEMVKQYQQSENDPSLRLGDIVRVYSNEGISHCFGNKVSNHA